MQKNVKEKKKPCLITCAQWCSLICLLALSVIQLYIILIHVHSWLIYPTSGAEDGCTVGMMEWLADPDARLTQEVIQHLFWKLS